MLKAQGSFFVGGEKVEQTEVELGSLGPGGHITVNQMYVRYMIPQDGDGVPVVMVHGATLTGKSWETTPDGRMGWDEYFVRKGHPVYVPDQVGRGRSGFNQAVFNDVRAGVAPAASQAMWLRFADENVWPNFRFGTKAGAPFADTQFPVTAVDELSKQAVPDPNRGLPQPNPTLKALSDLATQLKGAVLMGHSQSGSFPLESALLNVAAVKGLVLVEPGTCPAGYTPDQIAALAKVPILVVFGDHRENATGLPTLPTLAGAFRGVPGHDRPHQGRRRSGRDAGPAGPRHSRQQPHDHAGQEQPPDRRPDPAVDRRARREEVRRGVGRSLETKWASEGIAC